MPQGDEYKDSKYIPRPDYASMAQKWFQDDLAAKERLARLMGRIEPLRETWTPEDSAYLLSLGIKPF